MKRRKKVVIYVIVCALFYPKITCCFSFSLESESVLQPDEARTSTGETHSPVAF